MPRRKLFRLALAGYLLALPAALVLIVAVGPPRLGEGTLAQLARWVETTDLRIWFALGFLVVWLVPSVTYLLWRHGAHEAVYRLLEGRSVSMQVDVAGTIPVRVAKPMPVPVEVRGSVALDETLEIETEVPVKVTLPIDTEVQTSVLGLGRIKVPIKATVPLDLVIPLHTRARVRAASVPVNMKEEVVVTFPDVDLPVSASVEASVDVGVNLRAMGQRLRRLL